jgi:tRNA-guanine family transglycosylase
MRFKHLTVFWYFLPPESICRPANVKLRPYPVQGNFFKQLREESAGLAADSPGVAIGGLSVGEPIEIGRAHV